MLTITRSRKDAPAVDTGLRKERPNEARICEATVNATEASVAAVLLALNNQNMASIPVQTKASELGTNQTATPEFRVFCSYTYSVSLLPGTSSDVEILDALVEYWSKPTAWRKNFQQILPKVAGPPSWFKERMSAVRQTPPLTLQEIQKQFRAGVEQRAKLDSKPSSS